MKPLKKKLIWKDSLSELVSGSLPIHLIEESAINCNCTDEIVYQMIATYDEAYEAAERLAFLQNKILELGKQISGRIKNVQGIEFQHPTKPVIFCGLINHENELCWSVRPGTIEQN